MKNVSKFTFFAVLLLSFWNQKSQASQELTLIEEKGDIGYKPLTEKGASSYNRKIKPAEVREARAQYIRFAETFNERVLLKTESIELRSRIKEMVKNNADLFIDYTEKFIDFLSKLEKKEKNKKRIY